MPTICMQGTLRHVLGPLMLFGLWSFVFMMAYMDFTIARQTSQGVPLDSARINHPPQQWLPAAGVPCAV